MSDNTITIVDPEAGPGEAEGLAARVITHLQDRRIISTELTDCTLGAPGYPPGSNYAEGCGPDHGSFPRFAVNGVRAITERTVFDTGANGVELMCPCGSSNDGGEEYFEAVSAWHGGNEGALFTCPHCRKTRRLVDWDGPWAFGFGHLGIEFSNWPPLSDRFVASLAELLGHRVRVVYCHI